MDLPSTIEPTVLMLLRLLSLANLTMAPYAVWVSDRSVIRKQDAD
ncbi:MAG: hypothetical protein R3C62_15320 [Chloroflexota bacterium]